MKCSPGHAALLRKLRFVITPSEWVTFCRFHRSLAGRFDGEDFSRLTIDELETLSAYADRARE